MTPSLHRLEQLASQVVLSETTRFPAEPFGGDFERRFSRREMNPFPAWHPHPEQIRSYQLNNVVLHGDLWCLLDEDGLILGTDYLAPPDMLAGLAIDPEKLIRAGDGSTVVIGCNLARSNYFHWLTQAVPAIDHALRGGDQERGVALALPPTNAWQEQSLRLLGHAGVRRIVIDRRDCQYAFDHVEFSNFLTGRASFAPSEMARATYARLRKSVPPAAPRGRRLYVARTDASNRRMRSEPALIEALQARGFEVVVPGAYDFMQQIALFRSASLVVGPHGAGMSNIVFCEPGTIVYELVPAHYRNGCFCSLAHLAGLHYWADMFASEGEGEGLPGFRAWDIQVPDVLARLDEIEAVAAELRAEASKRAICAANRARA